MPHRYVEEMAPLPCLPGKRLGGVAPEVNLRERVTHTPLPSMNKGAHSGFETQRRCRQKSETGVSVAPQKRLMYAKFLMFAYFRYWFRFRMICIGPRVFYTL